MATNFVTDFTHTEQATRHARLSFEHRFFLAVAILFPLVNIIGFAPSYYFKAIFDPTPLPSLLVHAHGLVMSLWIVLFSVQAYLISSKRIKLHMTLGLLGVGLAVAIVVIGMMTGYAVLARGAAFPGYTPGVWFMIPVGDLTIFAVVFAAAIYFRKNAANHKRLMLVTMLNFLPPSIGRFPLPFILDLGTIWFLGVPALLGLTFLAVDTYRNGKINRAFAAAVGLLTLAFPLRMAIAYTEPWTRFTNWLIS